MSQLSATCCNKTNKSADQLLSTRVFWTLRPMQQTSAQIDGACFSALHMKSLHMWKCI